MLYSVNAVVTSYVVDQAVDSTYEQLNIEVNNIKIQ